MIQHVTRAALAVTLLAGVSLSTVHECGAAAAAKSKPVAKSKSTGDPNAAWRKEPGTYAIFETTSGTIVCKLMPEVAPKTVENFVGLAKGTKEWTDPKTGTKVKKPFYDGLNFHRVIDNFMVQGGCPLGTGTGDPGYKFADEFDPKVQFDRPGRLAMANSGPGTNGSQFFITHVATPWLNMKHTIFGEVVEGQDIVTAIGKCPKGPGDKPTPPITYTVKIEEVKAK